MTQSAHTVPPTSARKSEIDNPKSLQRQLPLKDPTFRPTVCLGGAKHLLDLNEDYILDLCADRALSFSWNIGLGEERREVRILRASIDHDILHGSKPHNPTEHEAFALLLPPGWRLPKSDFPRAFAGGRRACAARKSRCSPAWGRPGTPGWSRDGK